MEQKTVLITGASSGIGFALAKEFAFHDYNLILVARNREKLAAAAKELKTETNTIKLFAKDLSNQQSAHEIFDALNKQGVVVDILVNNAGFGNYGEFVDIHHQKETDLIALNITALTLLTKLFAKDMVARKSGKIINIASVAGFMPGPLMATYYASKAYVISFSQALREELRGTGVHVSVVCPGATLSSFQERAGLDKSKVLGSKMMTCEEVAHIAYTGITKNKSIIVTGTRNKMLVFLTKWLPRSIVPRLVKRSQEKR